MSDLTTDQLKLITEKLLVLQEELSSMMSDSQESSRPVGLDQPIGRLSRMDALQQQSMTQASRRAAQTRLAHIDQALKRIDRDNYGYCLECEEEIGVDRLTAKPETPFCLDCQSRKERK